MPVAWTIEGESGAGWDATARAPDFYGIGSGSVTRGSLAEDGMELSGVFGEWGGADFPRPTRHQRITLRRNGVVFFRGWARKARPVAEDGVRPRIRYQVVGPGYWLRRQPVRSARQAAGFIASANRAQMTLPSGQSLAQNLQAVVDAYNSTWGASDQRRIALGTVATAWSMQVINISGGDFLQALLDVLRNVPDAVAWWDYQPTTHVARLNVSRRPTATTRTLAYPGGCAMADFEELEDLEADGGVVVDYAEMIDDGSANTGRARYLQQASSGAFSGAVEANARAQRLTVSGPEIDSFLPDSAVESSTIFSRSPDWTYFRTSDSTLAAIPGVANLFLYINTITATDAAGNSVLPSRPYVLVGGDQRDWWAQLQQPILATEAEVGCRLQIGTSDLLLNTAAVFGLFLGQSATYPYGYYQRRTGQSGGYSVFENVALSQAQFEFWKIASIFQRVDNVATGAGLYQAATRYWGVYSPKLRATMINQFLWNQTVYKRPDFQFYAPPANLANHLSAAQAFTPWKGMAKVRSDEPGATAFAGCKLNVLGVEPEWETMGALVASHRIDLFSGTETISCGPPPRLSNLNLAIKLRTDPQGNITYL